MRRRAEEGRDSEERGGKERECEKTDLPCTAL